MSAVCSTARAALVTSRPSAKKQRSARRSKATRCPRAVATAEREVAAAADSLRPSSADCAKTLVTIANTGTISTVCEDGIALGTFASYVQTKSGELVLRMRGDAMHTGNIARDSRCSLYVQPATQPPGVLSRATLIGKLEKMEEGEDLDEVKAQYGQEHGENVGVDAMGDMDEYYHLALEKVFYVGGLGSDKRAEVVSAEEYAVAEPDVLCKQALGIVATMNTERYEDVVNFVVNSVGGEPREARMLWVDSLGFDVRAVTTTDEVVDVRVPFERPCTSLNEARSSLTMLAQVMWEEDKKYQPTPVELPKDEEEEVLQ